MLRKGHALSSGIGLMIALAVVAALAGAFEAAAAPFPPVGGASTAHYDELGRVSHHRYIGHTLPPLPRAVGTAQTGGPDPDVNLTLNATGSQELQPAGIPNNNLNRVAFASNGVDADEDGQIDDTLPVGANYDIWIMRPDGSEQFRVTNLPGDQIEPAYHPGSNVIAFAGNQTGRWEIYTVQLVTGVVQCLTDKQPGRKMHPTFNPDGNWIAYQCWIDSAANWDIYKMPANGSLPQQQLTTSNNDDTDPAWNPVANPLSPGGNAILYTAKTGSLSTVNWVDAETGDVETLSAGGISSDKEPAWSWDGQRIAFASNRLSEGDTLPDWNIWTMFAIGELSGPEAVLISNKNVADTTDDTNPTWTAALERQPVRIVYESKRNDGVGAEPDVWATFSADTEAPVLQQLPWVNRGTDNMTRIRQFSPGEDAYFHVPVYDAGSGVGRVFVTIKDPDLKQWRIDFWSGSRSWDSGFEGYQYLEYDYYPIASVELFDDGDPGNGDLTAGDGIFSGVWNIPANLSSDFVIDVLAIDASAAANGQNYDSIYGFTSQVFSPQGNILFVNDYCEGQKFIWQMGFNNDAGSQWYTESFYTFNPGYSPAATNQSPGEAYSVTKDTIKTYAAGWGVDEQYSIWRIICRGPIPQGVYQYYLPTVEQQLDPVEAADPERAPNATRTRTVRVAERGIFWACPHAGNLWVADGSLIDAGTQADLDLFLKRSGRLFVSGSDIAWALTLNGTVANDFLTNTLKATFVSDTYLGNYWMYYTPVGANRSRSQRVDLDWSIVGSSSDPVTFDPWAGTSAGPWSHYHALAQPAVYDSDDMPDSLTTPSNWGDQTPTSHDAHPYSWRPDVIQAGPDAVKLYGYGGAEGPTAGLRYEDPSGGRLVFLSFGFESIHRGYHTPSSLPAHCRNHRATLFHNAFCWMRTGSFQGKVVDVAGSKPITDPNPIVLLWRGNHNPGDRTTAPEYAVRCQDDGTWVISGIPPGFYSMEATRPGYDIDHYDGYVIHGGWEPFIVDFAITRARPGVVTGTVTSEANNETLALVDVTVYGIPVDEEDEENGTAGTSQTNGDEPDWDALQPVTIDGKVKTIKTGVDGTYKIEDLPPGRYYIRADGTGIGYGDDWAEILITAGNTTTQDFKLPAADGTLEVTVVDDADDTPIANASVQVRTQAGVRVQTGTTDAAGLATFSLQPGNYLLRVAAAGYGQADGEPALVQSITTSKVTVRLTAEAGARALSGKIVSATSGAPVGNILVSLLVNDVVVATTRTLAAFVDPAGDDPEYNYIFDTDVPTGEVVVRPSPVGFTASPAERTVTVASGVLVPNVNFTLNSLYVFPRGLQMVSAPYDYEGIDAATLLNVAPADLKLAAWEASRQRYRVYPLAPADQFRLGTGYWLRLDSATDITTPGTPAPDPTEIPLETGWNIIGDPSTRLIDLYTVMVRDQAGVTVTMQAALTEGTVDGGMFAYVLGGYQTTAILNPWVGAWIKVNKPVTLIVSESAGALSADTAATKAAIRQPEDGWLASIETSVDGLQDRSALFGQAATASAGHDAGLDMSKPPAADLGPYVYTSFTSATGGAYAVDVRSAQAEDTCWSMKVATSQTGSSVTLRWPDLSVAPAEVRPVLTDLATGKSVYMRTAPSYTFVAGDQPREFEITVSPATGAPLTVSGVSAQQTRGGHSQIAYTLSSAADVDVEILNVAGRLVKRVLAGASQAAGANTALWTGMSDAGTRVPRGRYLVRITARTDDGRQANAVQAFSVVR